MSQINTKLSERRANEKAQRNSNVTPLDLARRTSKNLPDGFGETGPLGVADWFKLAVAYNVIMDQPPLLRMYSDAWDMGEMLLGVDVWRGGYLLSEVARPIWRSATGRNEPYLGETDVLKNMAEDERGKAELQTVIDKAQARHLAEHALQKEWFARFDATPEDESFVEADPVPMFTALKWIGIGEKAKADKFEMDRRVSNPDWLDQDIADSEEHTEH